MGAFTSTIRPLVLVLAASLPALAQERFDLSGTWALRPDRAAAGGVTFSGRQRGERLDTYTMAVTLPDGGTRTLQATFDGATLRTVVAPAGGAPGGDGTRGPADANGITDVLRGTARAAGGNQPGTPAPTTSERPAPPATEGNYSASRLAATGNRPPAYAFHANTAVDRDSGTPVARFGRLAIELTVRGPAEVAPRAEVELTATVAPEARGTFAWTAAPAEGVTLAPDGSKVKVTGVRAGQVEVTCAFTSSVGDVRQAEHTLVVGKGIETIQLASITFTSDHGLMKKNDADWSATGETIPQPEWTKDAQHPISHTMDSAVTVRVELDVGPADAGATMVTLVGDGPGGVDFRQEVELKPGKNTVELTSTGKLERKVQKLELAIGWSVEGVPVRLEPVASSTPVFVTYGTPTAAGYTPGFTTRRMNQAVTAIGGMNTLDPHRIVRGIMSRWGRYNLQVIYHNAWELADDKTDASGRPVGADCQTIVRYTRDMITQAGVPGTAEFVVIWADPTQPAKGIESPEERNHMTRPPQYHNDKFPAAATPERREWFAILVDGDGGLNNYEAALKFSHDGRQIYYPGGVNGTMENVDQIIGVFTTMDWITWGQMKPSKGVIHAYR